MSKRNIKRFKDKFENFIDFLLENEIYSNCNSITQNAINKYKNVINILDYIKLCYEIYNKTTDINDNELIKKKIYKHDISLFLNEQYIIPNINFSDIYNITKKINKDNEFWEFFVHLKVLSNIIIDPLLNKKKENNNTLSAINNIDESIRIKPSEISLTTVSNALEENYKESSLLNFDMNNLSITDLTLNIVKNFGGLDMLNDIDDEQIKTIENIVKQFFGEDNDFSFIIKDITDSLKTTDFSKGNIEDNIINIAQSMGEKLINSKDEKTLKQMTLKAQEFSKDIDESKSIMDNAENIMKKRFGKSINDMGINKKDLEQTLKSCGIKTDESGETIISLPHGISKRKISRMATKQMQKQAKKPVISRTKSVNTKLTEKSSNISTQTNIKK